MHQIFQTAPVDRPFTARCPWFLALCCWVAVQVIIAGVGMWLAR